MSIPTTTAIEFQRKNFKDELTWFRAGFMAERAQQLLLEVIHWCESQGRNIVITATVSTFKEDLKVGRDHATHREGRAFDIRTRDWPKMFVDELMFHFESKYPSLGAISTSKNVHNLMEAKDHGTGPHIHVQLNKSYKANLPIIMERLASKPSDSGSAA